MTSKQSSSAALADIRRNAEFYCSEVAASQKRLADALEKHRHERERLEERLSENEARARDYQLVVDAAEASLGTYQDNQIGPASGDPDSVELRSSTSGANISNQEGES